MTLRGSASTKITLLGHLYRARWSSEYSISVSSSTSRPGAVTTYALTASPVCGCATPDDRGLGHGGMGGEHLLDLGGEHVEPRHDDQVLGPIDEVEVAVVVGGGHVAGVQPTVGVEHLGGRLGVAVVAGEHVVAANPDLADVADERVAVVVDQTDLDARQGTTDRSESRRDTRRRGDDRRRLGEAVALADLEAETLLHRACHADRQARRSGQRQPHGREGVGVEFVEVGERSPQRRCARDDGDAAVADRLDGGGGVESLHEHDGGADAESEPDHHVEPEDVEQREHAVDHVVGADVALRGAALVEVRLQVAVGEHRRTGRAGRAAGEHQHRELRAVDVDRLDGGSGEEVVEGHDVAGGGAADR